MKKRVEKYLPRAIELIDEIHIAQNGEVKNEFHGYFSSFGAAIIQSGLKPALAFFSNENSDVSKERAKLLKAIYKLVVTDGNDKDATALLKHIITENNESKLKPEIIDASVALKLAVRTYKLKK
jgi:CRISPR-associated protein Cmr5